MKNKKLVSTMLAATLAATTMAMPVMAADGGKVDVTVTNKDGILRVQVPTKMAVEIDPFEIAQKGCQIACVDEFDMINYSQMDVKVDVTSTVARKSGVNLVPSKETATSSSTAGEAWLAVAAKTSGDKSGDAYDDLSTGDNTTPKKEKYWELTEANANVTTFSASGDAKQTFYLGQASGDAQDEIYTQVVATQKGKPGLAYAKFYELAKDSSISGDAGLKAAVAEKDMYVAVSGDADRDKKGLTKIEKGTENVTYTAGSTYYAVSGDAAVEGDDVEAGTTYMYAALKNQGGEAGFRYVGNLSSANTTAWSNKDITGITINYAITGVSKSDYDTIKDQCTYGLFPSVTGPQISVTKTGLVSVTNLTADQNYSAIEITVGDGSKWDINADGVTWNDSTWNASTGGYFSVQLGDSWMNFIRTKGGTATIVLKLTDQTEETTTLTL